MNKGRWLSKMEELFGADLRSLAALRIGVAVMLLADLYVHATNLRAHFTDWGILPRYALFQKFSHPWVVSVHFMSGELWVQALLFAIHAIFAGLLLVGYRTRLATFVSWFLLVSLQARNPLAMQGSDVLHRMLLFWGLFLPWGAKFSVDAACDSSRAKHPVRVLCVGTMGYLAQVVIMYVFSGLLKTGVPWKDGTAIYYALNIDQFTTPFGRSLLAFPNLLHFLSLAVRRLELWGPWLFFIPVFIGPIRTLTVAAFCFLQIGFGICLTVGEFYWIAQVAMLGFLPSWFWDRVALPLAERMPLRRSLPFRDIPWLRPRPLRVYSGPVENFLAAFFALYVLFWNLGMLEPSERWVPKKLEWLGVSLGLEQSWNMFAPTPLMEDGWYVIPARLRDGRVVDLFKNGQSLRWEKPKRVSAMYKDQRWRKYFSTICAKYYADYRLYYAQYLCREWNERHEAPAQVMEFEINFMLETTLPNYQKPRVEKLSLWYHYCFDVPGKSSEVTRAKL